MAANKAGIITQARTTSTRLPRKVLLEVNGKSVLEWHIERLQKSGLPVFVATTINKTDDPIVGLCERLNVPYHRGSENDVLSRFYETAKEHELDIVVRVTSDCPLIDGELIGQNVEKFKTYSENTYLSNCIERTFPRGFDFEVFSFSSLENAFKNASEAPEREHVTPFIRNTLKNTGVNIVHIKRLSDASQYRLTLDEKDDWTLIEKLIVDFYANQKNAEEIIELMKKFPELHEINAHIEQKKV